MAMTEVGAGDYVTAETLNYIIQRAVNRPVCRLVLPAVQSLANNTTVPIAFGVGSEIMDDLNWHSTSSNTSRITPTYAGRYLVSANITFASNATGDRRAYILKTGVGSMASTRAVAVSGAVTVLNFVDILEANGTTDYFELAGLQTSGAALNVSGSGDTTVSTMFEIAYLGDLL